MTPEVSVIIPAYNTDAYIVQAIESVLNQTLNNLEIIVVDDASTDNTVTIVKSFTDPRVKMLINAENMGTAVTRNRAIKAASGTWIALLDSDDWYAPDRLEKLLVVANSQGANMVADDLYYINDREKFPWSTLFTESGKKIDKTIQIDPVFFVNTDLPGVGGLTLGLSKPMIKREFLLKYKIEYLNNIRLGQDFWFYLECLARGGNFFIIPEAYYFYRSHLGALTKKSNIERYEQYCEASEFFLQQDFIHSNHELSKAVSNRLKRLRTIRPYFQVVDTIKQGDLWQIFIDMLRNPYFFIHVIYYLPKRLKRLYKLTLTKWKKN